MTLIGVALPILLSALTSVSPTAAQDSAAIVRRVAATATLAAQEYRIGVAEGRIVAAAEVEEARLFLEESRRSAAALSASAELNPVATVDSLLALVKGLGAPDSLDARVRSFNRALADRFGVSLDELPSRPPDLALGAEVYRANCAGCHGDVGRGDGPLAPGSRSAAGQPRRLGLRSTTSRRSTTTAASASASSAPRCRRSRTGSRLEDRWAVALYASTLRLPPPSGEAPRGAPGLRHAPARCPTPSCSTRWPRRTMAPGAGSRRLAAVRSFQSASLRLPARSSAVVRAQVDSVYALARTGDPGASHPRARRLHDLRAGRARAARAKNPGPRRRARDRLRGAPDAGRGRRRGPRARRRCASGSPPGLRPRERRAGRRGSRRPTCSSSRSSSCCARGWRRS